MKLSTMAKFAIFVGIALGGLGGVGSIYNHYFPSGGAKVEQLKPKVDFQGREIERLSHTVKAYGKSIGDNRSDIENVKIDIQKAERKDKDHDETLKQHEMDITSNKERSTQNENELASTKESLDKAQSQLSELETNFKNFKDAQQKREKEQTARADAQEERIKRLERLLGVDSTK